MDGGTCLRIWICGRLAIEHDSAIVREAELPARQGRRLWAYLVLNRRWPVGRDDLAAAIWGDDPPEAWDTALNALVSRLRLILRRLDVPAHTFALRGEVGRYALTLPVGTFVDADRARLALHETDRLIGLGNHAGALAEARVALEIAGRGFLHGEDAPWIHGQRRALTEIRLLAQERTVEAELGRGRADLAEREARALVGLDPLREEGWRLLMQALADGGNAAGAAQAYAECRAALRGGADAAPSAATERLYRDLTRSSS